MFNKSIKKIIIMVMSILFLFVIGIVTVIFLSSYIDSKKENEDRLERYAYSYIYDPNNLGPAMEYRRNFVPDDNQYDRQMPYRRMDMLSSFYSVLYNSNNEIIKIDLSGNIYTEEEIKNITSNILKENSIKGSYNELLYLVTTKDDYKLVSCIDMTITNNSSNKLLNIIIVIGISSMVIAFIISLIIAKKIVKPLELNDKKQKQFISDAGHELKTPVSVINANLELLEKEVPDNEWLNNIKYENERMRLLVTELLDLSRAENKKMEFSKINLSHLVTGEALPFDAIAYEAGIKIESNIKDDIYVLGYETELKKLISILLDNAIKHNDGGDTIFINLFLNHKYATISVENSAKTLTEEEISHLFERFYRADEARTDGTHYGLGLAIAKAVVDNHKGKIKVESNNNKVKFIVEIPSIK